MTIGGFGSLAAVAFFRELGLLSFRFVPRWMSISEEISLLGISNFTVTEATNLIIIQSLLGIIGGVLIGSLQIILTEGETKERKNLNEPWEEFEYQAAYDQKLTVITESDNQITGKLFEVGNSNTENDLLLINPKESQFTDDGIKEGESRGEISYHHQRDISRIVLHNEWDGHDRNVAERYHRDLLNYGLTGRNRIVKIGSTISSKAKYPFQRWQALREYDVYQGRNIDALDIDEEVSLDEADDKKEQSKDN
ncbi:hypothetical protein EGH22_09735 [Halomicroarcula sp. F28]|uniref:hypothetical protein n=1 Tax=Haloarcula salinisoli TaxID=2487746 RepID=UPI001C72B0D7|nr:hypothetical protein [Halomicroarcula salinisoli]MBX0286607.1 hypothetical protein [Halomicroarcula salinisoli]